MKKLLALLLLSPLMSVANTPLNDFPSTESTCNYYWDLDSDIQDCINSFKTAKSIEEAYLPSNADEMKSPNDIKLKLQTERTVYKQKNECISILAESTDNYAIYLDCMKNINNEQMKDLVVSTEERKKQEEAKRMSVIHALKERCISYGFTGSNNIAACVQREAQHDYEIESQKYEFQLAQQNLQEQINQIKKNVTPRQVNLVEEVPWYLSVLEAVAEGVEEGYKQKALIQTMDSRYEKKDIYRYCRPNC
ncbi:hypothetical protein N8448_03410 [Gammaproteobacteria bacterium]|nr:hypothetical protein [Gammaproteobacteria bacterium]